MVDVLVEAGSEEKREKEIYADGSLLYAGLEYAVANPEQWHI